MKIADVKTYLVGNPWKTWLFVRVETDEGIHGIGEGSLCHMARAVETAVHELKPLIIGYEPFQTEAIVHRLSRDVFADGGQIKMCAISAIEIACWDIVGKALDQPIFNLIGGRCRDRVRAYANGWYRCPRTPHEFSKRAKEVVGMGYTALKFDPFGVAWRQLTREEEHLSIDIVAAVREAVGPNVDLAIEAHARFSVDTAIHVGKLLEPLNPVWYEDPVPHHNPHATIEVARRLSIPVGTGESLSAKQQFVELLRDDAITIVTVEPLNVGGILATRKLADMVDAHYGVIVPHSAQGPICTLACLHINVSTPNSFMQEYFDQFNVSWERDLLTWTPKLEDGHLELPTAPGLGADLNMDVVREHPYTGTDMNLWDDQWHLRRDKIDQ